jgi:hypothetical protein
MKRLLVLAVAACGAVGAQAAPTEYNGHYYDYVNTSLSWTDAAAAAASSTLDVGGVTYFGQLATIADFNENDTVRNLSPWTVGWIGLSRSGNTWAWVDGSAFSYDLWNVNEPNNYGGTENYVAINVNGPGGWNDYSNAATNTSGYFVEYTTAPTAAVPEPESYAMMLAGLGVIGGVARRRAKSKKA